MAAGDELLIADVSDSNNIKKVTAQSIANLGGGAIGQVLSTIKTDTFTMSSSTFADVTGLSVAITPASTASTILVMFNVNGSNNTAVDNSVNIRLLRDSTDIAQADAASNRTLTTATITALNTNVMGSAGMSFIDTPATMSEVIYKIQIAASNDGDAHINRSNADSDISSVGRATSSISVLEIL